jgi:hypothetical protein
VRASGLAALLWLAASAARAAAADAAFEVRELPADGLRSVAAELADLDGDGRTDLLRVGFADVPPAERRVLRVHLQHPELGLPEAPSFELPLPEGAAAYDLADVKPAPGAELILLLPDGLLVLSLASPAAPRWRLPVAGGSSLAAAADELGLDRLRIASDAFGPEPWLLVPLLRETVALSSEGRELARWETGARANYYLQRRPGPLAMGTDLQLRLETPRLDLGDVDGDGATDVVALGRYEIRVFLRRAEGGFARAPDRVLAPPLVSERDHLRGSGAVRGEARDLDGDGRLDLLLSLVSGGLLDARTRTSVHLNRGGTWRLDAPERVFESEHEWCLEELIDLDGDRRPELVRTGVPFGVLALIEVLVTRAFDAEVRVYRPDPVHGFEAKPWLERELELPMSFESGRTLGFVPMARLDLNGDGHRDLLLSGAGEHLEVWLGGARAYARRDARQALRTTGRLTSGDIDADGLPDLALYDPRDPQASLRIARNLGVLEGTLPRVSARPREK